MTAPASPTEAAVETMVVWPPRVSLRHAWLEVDPTEDVGVVDVAGAITAYFGDTHVHVTRDQLKDIFDAAAAVLSAPEIHADRGEQKRLAS